MTPSARPLAAALRLVTAVFLRHTVDMKNHQSVGCGSWKTPGVVVLKSFFCLLLGLVASGALGAEPAGQFKFGIFGPKAEGQTNRIVTETLTLPLKTEQMGFGWGYEYTPAGAAEYKIREVFYLPAPPAVISGDLTGSKDSPTIVKSPEEKATGRYSSLYHFDAGDPLGEWKVEIFVDGKLVQSLKFQVVAVK